MRAAVTSVERSTEGDKTVLRFVVTLEAKKVLPVEMRGDQLRGVLRDGDEVEVPPSAVSSGTWNPTELRNTTTNADLTSWTMSPVRRAGKWLAAGLIGGVLSAAGTLIVTSIQPGESQLDGGTSAQEAWAWLFVVVSAVALIAELILLLVRPPEKKPKPSHLASAIGGVIGTLVVALSVS